MEKKSLNIYTYIHTHTYIFKKETTGNVLNEGVRGGCESGQKLGQGQNKTGCLLLCTTPRSQNWDSLLWVCHIASVKMALSDSPDGSVVKNPPAQAGDSGLILDPGRSHMPWRKQAHGATTTEPTL